MGDEGLGDEGLGDEGLPDLVPMDVGGRLPRLLADMGEGEDRVDALVVTDLTNIRYLTGFTGSAATLVVAGSGLTFLTDGRYGDQAPRQLAAAGVEAELRVARTSDQTRELLAVAVRERVGAGHRRVGLEADHVTWNDHRRYADWFADAIDLVPTSGLVEGLRLVKDDGEVARIAAACAIADDALAAVRPRLHDGITEAQFGLELDAAMRARGASDRSFETIVAAGPNGALPHARPGPRLVAEGDLVVIDFGAIVDGYCSDMTRTVMVGEPTDVQVRLWEVVAEAQAAGVAVVRPGVEAKAVDAACREVIDAAGWADRFTHSTGHGVGLHIHEAPRVGTTSTTTLDVGQVVTVEPGVYLPDVGGVRIEDTVVVTADGCRPLTLTPKSFAA